MMIQWIWTVMTLLPKWLNALRFVRTAADEPLDYIFLHLILPWQHHLVQDLPKQILVSCTHHLTRDYTLLAAVTKCVFYFFCLVRAKVSAQPRKRKRANNSKEWQIDPTAQAIMTAIEKEGKHYLQHTDVKIYFPYAYHNVAVISVRKKSFSFFGLHQWCV